MKVSSASLPRFVLDLNADDGRPSALPLVATGAMVYAPGPGVSVGIDMSGRLVDVPNGAGVFEALALIPVSIELMLTE